jgi:KDO2-lipid IV(A) lauroyltransferase
VRAASRAGGAFAELGYSPLGIRRGVTERQNATAFQEWNAAQVEAIARESYRNLGRVAIEATLVSRGTAKDVLALFGPSPTWRVVDGALAKGRGLLLVAGHLGNWELAGAYIAARGVPVHPIARGMSNPLSDAYFRRTRERLGMHIMHDQQAVRRVPRVLRDGQAVGFLSDQATVGLASTFVPFFGRPAKTPRGDAVFSRGGAPPGDGHAVRQPGWPVMVVAEDIPVAHRAIANATWTTSCPVLYAGANGCGSIGQYFWHRRWKHQPDDTPPG